MWKFSDATAEVLPLTLARWSNVKVLSLEYFEYYVNNLKGQCTINEASQM